MGSNMSNYTPGPPAGKGKGRSRRLHTPQEVIDALQAHGCKGQGERWQCPAHTGKDKGLSLSVREAADGAAMLRCHSRNCTTTDILKAIGLLGERVKTENEKMGKTNGLDEDPMDPAPDETKPFNPPPGYSAQYDYNDASGKPVGSVWRYENKDGTKTFLQATAPDNDRWTTPAPERWPLFRLAEVLEADPAKPVIVVEGEKCALALAKLGYVTTCWPGGSNLTAVHKADYSRLEGRDLILWPDNDAPGRKAMEEVARIIGKAARSLRKVEPPEEKTKGWDGADATQEEVRELIESAQEFKPDSETKKEPPPKAMFRKLSERNEEVLPEKYESPPWLFADENGNIVLEQGITAGLSAQGDMGKSRIALDFALCAASQGQYKAMGRYTAAQEVRVLYIHAEDNALSRQNRRWGWRKARGAKSLDAKVVDENLWTIDMGEYPRGSTALIDVPAHCPPESGPLIETIKEMLVNLGDGPVLIVIDPLAQALGGYDETNVNLGCAIFELRRIQYEFPQTTILLVHHIGKAAMNAAFREALGAYAARGGSTFVDGVRQHFSLRPLQKKEHTAVKIKDPLAYPGDMRCLDLDKFNDGKKQAAILAWENGAFTCFATGAELEELNAKAEEDRDAERERHEANKQEFQKHVIEMLEKEETASMKELIEGCGYLGEKTAKRIVKKLKDSGEIHQHGKGKATRYGLQKPTG